MDTLRKEAKRWLKALRTNDPDARARLERAYPKAPAVPVLRDVQHALARERGYENWLAMTRARERPGPASAQVLTRDGYERLAQDYVLAFDAQDAAALQRLNTSYSRAFTFEDLFAEIWRRVYAFRQRSSRVPKNFLSLDEAQMLVAQNAGFGSWDALIQSLETGASPIPPYAIDTQRNAVGPRRMLSGHEWDQLIAVMKERRIEGLTANGLMTDALLERIADLDHVVALGIGGSRGLSDEGLLQLARMPQLKWLNLSEYPGGKLTDRGLEALRHLPNLRVFEMTWQKGISDAGVAHLRFCDQLERVDLMGSPTGDGASRRCRERRSSRRSPVERWSLTPDCACSTTFPGSRRGRVTRVVACSSTVRLPTPAWRALPGSTACSTSISSGTLPGSPPLVMRISPASRTSARSVLTAS